MIEIKMNHTESGLVIVIGTKGDKRENYNPEHDDLEELAKDVLVDVVITLKQEEDAEDDNELKYDLTMMSCLMEKLLEQDNFEGAFHFALGILHIPYTDAGIEKIREEIALYDDGEKQFLHSFIEVIDAFCSDLEEED